MANVANTKATGPASPNAISGGKKLPFLTNEADMSGHSLAGLSTSSEEARRTIMSMRIQSTPYLTQSPEASRSKLQGKRNVSNIPNKDFTST